MAADRAPIPRVWEARAAGAGAVRPRARRMAEARVLLMVAVWHRDRPRIVPTADSLLPPLRRTTIVRDPHQPPAVVPEQVVRALHPVRVRVPIRARRISEIDPVAAAGRTTAIAREPAIVPDSQIVREARSRAPARQIARSPAIGRATATIRAAARRRNRATWETFWGWAGLCSLREEASQRCRRAPEQGIVPSPEIDREEVIVPVSAIAREVETVQASAIDRAEEIGRTSRIEINGPIIARSTVAPRGSTSTAIRTSTSTIAGTGRL